MSEATDKDVKEAVEALNRNSNNSGTGFDSSNYGTVEESVAALEEQEGQVSVSTGSEEGFEGIDRIDSEEKTADVTQIPHNSTRDSIYVHKNPLPGSVFDVGDLAGYDIDGNLWVVETEGWEYHDMEGNQIDGGDYLQAASEALSLEVAGYLNHGKRFHGDNFVAGEDLHYLAENTLDADVDRKLEEEEVRTV